MVPNANANDLGRAKGPALLKRAVSDLRELVTVEVELAKGEVVSQAKEAVAAFALIGSAAVLFILSLTMVLFAVILARGATPGRALAAAVMLVAGSVALGLLGYKKLPKKPLERTEKRIKRDVREVGENVSDLKEAVTR